MQRSHARNSHPYTRLHARARRRLTRLVAALVTTLLTVTALLAGGALPAAAATVPAGFNHVVIATGLAQPAAMTVAPDGRVFITEKGGWNAAGTPLPARVRIIKNGVLLATPFVTITNSYGGGERGLLGIVLDPGFATNKYVYIYYTAKQADGTFRNRVSRLIANGDVAQQTNGVPTEKVLIQLDLASSVNHQGGGLHFGTDGKLYISTGDNKQGDKTPLLSSTYGKILRINSDGTIPTNNPFYASTTGIYRAIWARGLRNPFTFAVQPGSGRIFINDVGENLYEEINDGIAGSNYGWPASEGPATSPGIRSPLYYYGHGPVAGSTTSTCAITGGAFYNPAVRQFPADYVGKYLFADFCGNFIKRYDPATGAVSNFALTESNPVDVRVASDGSVYYLTSGGKVVRIRYTGSSAPSISSPPASYTASVGESATFRVTATGAAPLSYQWQRGGVPITGATGTSYTLPSVKTTDNGAQFRVVVKNASGTVTSPVATLTVTTNKRPTATFSAPALGATYAGGQTITYSATASDVEDGTLAPQAFSWKIDLHHGEHSHPFQDGITGVRSGTFVVPRVGETATNVFYRIQLTVKDSQGLTRTVYRDVKPRIATLSFATSPAGLSVSLDGQPRLTPYSTTSVVGVTRQLAAPTTQVAANGDTYRFTSWSDAGAAVHNVNTPSTATTYTARYTKITAPDLVVTAIGATPAAPQPGQTVRFSATIKNNGSAATPAGVKHGVLFSVNGVRVSFSDTSTTSLAAGASRTVAANGTVSGYTGATGGLWKATAGQPTVKATVDDVNRMVEVNETNNSYSRRIAVGPQPDLVVTSVNASPASPVAGSQVRFTAVIKNQGTTATPAGVIHGVVFRINGKGVTFSDTSTTSLAAGASRTLTANGGSSGGLWTATSGTHTLLAYVDDVNRITEAVETNNTLSKPFAVP